MRRGSTGRAHPRSRGENRNTPSNLLLQCGSSPLTRGKLPTTDQNPLTKRLIPAHAGKTQCSSARLSAWPAHPRSRGENAVGVEVGAGVGGSSPLTRGKRDRPLGRADSGGLIPAHAGKTASEFSPQMPSGAHPRSRGENPGQLGTGIVGAGSSPLTRGKPDRVHRHALTVRLIPAHAGKTWVQRGSTSSRAAHPRSRGENSSRDVMMPGSAGSSPLTRGKHRQCWELNQLDRLIPAHAGKTGCRSCFRGWQAAHPRSRGENYGRGVAGGSARGSSPLTRGKREGTGHTG